MPKETIRKLAAAKQKAYHNSSAKTRLERDKQPYILGSNVISH